MRNAFADEVLNLAEEDDNLVVLSADTGNRLFDEFKNRFPTRFINCGIAEANMTGVASGLCMSGMRPITYTIAAFNTFRCLEQIRVDICYHNLPVIIVGVGAGLSYANLGYTHHANEDIGILRTFPNMSILCPADPMEVRGALRGAHDHDGPVYIRLGKKDEPKIHERVPPIKIGGSSEILSGKDICILAVGPIIKEAIDAAELFKQKDISTKVISFYSAKPIDQETLARNFSTVPFVVALEEHSAIGGIGSAISEWMVLNSINPKKFIHLSLPDLIPHQAGSQSYLRKKYGLTASTIFNRVTEQLHQRDQIE